MSPAPRWIALAAVLASALLVATAWPRFSQFWDEPAHLAAGMEWLDRGTFEYEELTPPLGRVAGALGPYLSGIRSQGRESFWDEGNAILASGGHYRRTLVLARAGLLPFLLLGAWSVWAWAKRLAGPWAASAAVVTFVGIPVVVGHAGVAATDLPLCATMAFAWERLARWLDAPSGRRAAWLGVAAALATLAKFSAIPFLAGSCALFAAARLLATKAADRGGVVRAWTRTLAMAAVAALVVIWAGYRFRLDPLVAKTPVRPGVVQIAGARGPLRRALELPIYPYRSFLKGLRFLGTRTAISQKSFLEGEVYRGARPAFFFEAFLLRTPPALLLLLALAPFAAWHARRRRGWAEWAPWLAIATGFAVGLTGHLNLGLRLLLPVYAAVAVVAGTCAADLASRGRAAAVLAGALIAAPLATSAWAWPNAFSYFNGFAGPRPERHLVDSDLDWGQDLFALSDTLRARGVDSLSIAYAGTADLANVPLPPHHVLAPDERVHGWVALSAYALDLGRAHDPVERSTGYRWLDSQPLVTRAGRSILLYRVP